MATRRVRRRSPVKATRRRRPVKRASIDEELHSILSQLEDELEVEDTVIDETFDDDLVSMDEELDEELIMDDDIEELVVEDDLEAEIEDLENQLEDEVPEEALMLSKEDIHAEIKQLEDQLYSKKSEEDEEEDEEVEEASEEDVPEVEDVENEIQDDVGGGDPSLSVEFPEYVPDEGGQGIRDVVGSRKARKIRNALRSLNKIAELLERKGDKRHASAVDMVANTIESETGIKDASF